MKKHYIPPYFRNPTHPITVSLIGCGGTGSNVLGELASLHMALKALGHPGIHVTVYDSDIVEETNIGRQRFFSSDIGEYKASILVSRVNAAYGLNWVSIPLDYTKGLIEMDSSKITNLIISCVDTVSSRKTIESIIVSYANDTFNYAYSTPYYWLDYGNSKDKGQVILSTFGSIEQNTDDPNQVNYLPNIFDLNPDIELQEEDDSPSCSAREALLKQDLFINSFLSTFGMQLIWKLFREFSITSHGVYANISNMTSQPIKIK